MKKIFFLGLNKTAGISLYFYFKKKYNTVHSSVNKYEWVNDTTIQNKKFLDKNSIFIEINNINYDIDWLYKNYNSSLFILQYRNLKEWLVSRWNHVELNKKFNRSLWLNNSKDEILKWIQDRNFYHKKIYDYFNDKSNFIIKNTNDDFFKKIKRYDVNKNYKIYYDKNPKDVLTVLKNLNLDNKDYDKLYL